MKVLSLPTWIVTRLLEGSLPAGHPWRGRRFTLEEWAAGQTELCRDFDMALWASLLLGIAIGVILV